MHARKQSPSSVTRYAPRPADLRERRRKENTPLVDIGRGWQRARKSRANLELLTYACMYYRCASIFAVFKFLG